MSGTQQTVDTGGSQTQAPPPDTQTQAPPTDWIGQLAPELRQVVEVKGYKTPADVVQAYAHAQKAIGADKIVLPNKDTGEWDADARTKLGIPADPSGYEVKRPENLPQGMQWDEKFEQAAKPIAHKLGLTPKQVSGLMDFYAAYQGDQFKTGVQEATRTLGEAEALLKKDWGTAYDVNVQRAKSAAKHFGGDAFVRFLNESGMGNNTEVIRIFAKIGSQMTEDQLQVGQGSGFGMTPAQARAEANKLMNSKAYNDKADPEHAQMVDKVEALFRQAFPE